MALVVGTVYLGSRGNTPVPGAVATPAPTSAMGTAPSTPDQEPDEEPDADPSIQQTQCWDGTVTEDASSCGEPSGADGVRYIYPVFDGRGVCASKAYRDTTVTFDCGFLKREVVRYRWWRDTSEAERHYRSKYRKGAATPLVVAGRTVGTTYRDLTKVNGIYRLSAFMWDHFSFTVEAPTRSRQEVLLKVIQMRHPADYAGYPLEDGPKELVHVMA